MSDINNDYFIVNMNELYPDQNLYNWIDFALIIKHGNCTQIKCSINYTKLLNPFYLLQFIRSMFYPFMHYESYFNVK